MGQRGYAEFGLLVQIGRVGIRILLQFQLSLHVRLELFALRFHQVLEIRVSQFFDATRCGYRELPNQRQLDLLVREFDVEIFAQTRLQIQEGQIQIILVLVACEDVEYLINAVVVLED